MPSPSAAFTPWLGVFETLRVVDGVPLFVAEHRTELVRARDALGLTSDVDLEQTRSALPRLSGRWRWIVTPEATTTLFSEESPASTEPRALSVSPVRVGSANWDARFKTLSYLSHAQAGKMATTPEVILLNEDGQVASASRANLFWRRGNQIFTPAHEAGCRRGVVRTFVLRNQTVEEGHFSLQHLQNADEIFLTNSMTGIVSVSEILGRTLTNFSCADKLREDYATAVAAQVAG